MSLEKRMELELKKKAEELQKEEEELRWSTGPERPQTNTGLASGDGSLIGRGFKLAEACPSLTL